MYVSIALTYPPLTSLHKKHPAAAEECDNELKEAP